MAWYDGLRFQILRRDALEPIEGQPPAADPNLRAMRGRGFMELEEWAKAIAELDRALELRPADAQIEALRDQCRARLAKEQISSSSRRLRPL